MFKNLIANYRTFDTTDNNDLPVSLKAGLQTIFYKRYNSISTYYDKICTIVESDSESEDYSWLSSGASVREFGAERIPKGLSEFSYTIKNKEYESSISVRRATLKDDKKGQIKARINDMAERARRFRDELTFALLEKGATTLCYDGQYFFDTDHSEGNSGTQSNKLTTALSCDQFGVAKAQMLGFKDDEGKPLGLTPTHLVVPGGLEQTARMIANNDIIYSGTVAQTNPWKGTIEVMVVPYLTDTNNWYLMDLSGYVKPLVFQIREEIEFDALEDDSETGFMRKEFVYGTYQRCNVGFGDWRRCVGNIV